MQRLEVLDALGRPSDSLAGESEAESSVWWYGNAEVHFDRSDRVYLIHFDDLFGIPNGGTALQMDPWVLKEGLPCGELEAALQTERIIYRTGSDESMNPGCVKVVTQGNVYLVVQVAGEPDQIGLRVFGTSAA